MAETKIFAVELLDNNSDMEAEYILDTGANIATYLIFDELASAISLRTANIARDVFVELLTKKYTTSYDTSGGRSGTRQWSASFTGGVVNTMKVVVEEPTPGIRIASVVETGDVGKKLREGTTSENVSESALLDWMITKRAWPEEWTGSKANPVRTKFTKYGGRRANIRSAPGRPHVKRLRALAKVIKGRIAKQGTSTTLGGMSPVGTHSGGGNRYDYVRYAVDKRRSIMNPLETAVSANPSLAAVKDMPGQRGSDAVMGLTAEVLIWYWRTGKVRTEMYKQLYSDYDMFKAGVPFAPREIYISG